MLTWQQLGLSTKAVGFLNAAGFYDHLMKFFDTCVDAVRAFDILCTSSTCITGVRHPEILLARH